MKIPTRRQAEKYIQEGARMNPGPWIDHSYKVAAAASAIAVEYPGLDPEASYILGLLHDIGRREGVYGMRHIMDGYEFMMAEGYPDAARICLTHSYPVPHVMAGSSPWDGTNEQESFVAHYLVSEPITDYDKLIQLCDSLCLPNGPVLMEKRLVDVVMRYGFNDYTLPKWQGFFKIKEEFESNLGCSIYQLLPDVETNTFGF